MNLSESDENNIIELSVNKAFFQGRICECSRTKYEYYSYDDNWFLRCLKCGNFLVEKIDCGHIRLRIETKLCSPVRFCKFCELQKIHTSSNEFSEYKIQRFFESLLNEVHFSENKELCEIEYRGIKINLLVGDQYNTKTDSLICHSCYYPIRDIAHSKIRERICYRCIIDQILTE